MSRDEQDEQNDSLIGLENFRSDARNAIIAGSLAGAIILAGSWMTGHVSGGEARHLLEIIMPNVRSFSGTVVLASGTILALMLTLLGLSTSTDADLTYYHYQRVKQIARIDTATFIAAVLIYLLLNVPIEESDKSNVNFFYVLYYATLIISSALAGAVITVVLMLYNTIKDIINVLGPGETKSYIKRTQEEE